MPKPSSKSKIKQGRPSSSRNSKAKNSLSALAGPARSGGEGQGEAVPVRQSNIHWERILLIHQRIKSGSCPSAPALAAELETSQRTILRDIQFMKDRLRLPIQYDQHRYGFTYTGPADNLPLPPLSEADLFSLLVAHKAIAQYLGTPFEKPLRLAFDKLTRGPRAVLGSQPDYTFQNLDAALSFRPFAPEDTDLHAFQTITKAIATSKALKFLYRNRAPLWSAPAERSGDGAFPDSASGYQPSTIDYQPTTGHQPSTKNNQPIPPSAGLAKSARPARSRLVHPYHLACINNLWYLFAWDPAKRDLRTFALHRLTRPQLTTEKFAKPKNFDPAELLRGSLNVFKGREDHDILIQFDPWAADEIRDRRWHSSQQITNLPNGGCQLRLRLSSFEEIEGWILSFGTHATVLQPPTLMGRLAKIAASILEKYRA
jgi:predicted DNA-binding transcriptional regulator YafY